MNKDIESREDIDRVLTAFYQKVFDDAMIGHFFTQVVQLDLKTHLPQITDFWEAVVFQRHTYRKNVMEVHQHLHQLSPVRKEHLDQWVMLFTQTVDAHFEGNNATLMKQRAASIANLMDIKLNYNSINK